MPSHLRGHGSEQMLLRASSGFDDASLASIFRPGMLSPLPGLGAARLPPRRETKRTAVVVNFMFAGSVKCWLDAKVLNDVCLEHVRIASGHSMQTSTYL